METARLLTRHAFHHVLRRDAKAARRVVIDHVDDADRCRWFAKIGELLQWSRDGLRCNDDERRVRLIFFRFPYYLWTDTAFGVIPAFTRVPDQFDEGNYHTARHPAVYKELQRLADLGYLEGPLDDNDEEAAWVVMPLGAVPKKDSDKPRVVLDGTACGLNDATHLLRFKYPAFQDVLDYFYPGGWLFKLDWTDAFFTNALYPPFRRYFAVRHPRTGKLWRYRVLPFGWKLSPYYYARVVHSYVDLLRCAEPFRGQLHRSYQHHPVHHGRLPMLHRRRRDGQLAADLDQYCDDGIGFAPTQDCAHDALRQAIAHVHHLGARPKDSKTVPPTQRDSVLGLGVDTSSDHMSVFVPEQRLRQLRSSMVEFEAQYR